MKYKYYFGPSGSGKSTQIMDDLIKMSKENPFRNYYLIVPDQYTMQAQKDMVMRSPEKGIMNIDVLSFGRLSHAVADEAGDSNCMVLDDTGKNLLIRRVALDLTDKLPAIGSSIGGQGIIHEIKSVISEFMQYGYSPEDVDAMINCADQHNMKSLKYKLMDLQTLYKAFQEYKQDKYITAEETLGVLAEKIPKAASLKNSIIAFDGFTGFTPVQKKVLTALLHVSDEVWFSICVDEKAYHGDKKSAALFDLSLKTLSGLDNLCRLEGAEHLDDCMLFDMDTEFRKKVSSDIRYLEKNLFRNQEKPFSYLDKTEAEMKDKSEAENKAAGKRNIFIHCDDNPRSEFENVCLTIRKLVRKKGYEYRDIAIVTGDLPTYSQYADEMFGRYELPGFVDSSRKLVFNPFTDHIKSCLNVVYQNFSYQTVMHFMRSGISVFTPDEIDEFENYIMALKIKGKKAFSRKFERHPGYLKIKDSETEKMILREDAAPYMEKINGTRERIFQLFQVFEGLEKGKHRAGEYINSLYKFIESEDAFHKLLEYTDYFEKTGDFGRKKEYDQIYDSVMRLLEQIYDLISEDELDIKEFMDILEAGISEIRIGVLPAQVDSIVMGDIERTRLSKVKVLFFMGVNDSNIPKNNSMGGMISDLDREFFNSAGIELSPSPRQKMFDQRLYLYMNMTKPSQALYVSYAKTGADGKAIRPSYLIDTITEMYSSIPVTNSMSASLRNEGGQENPVVKRYINQIEGKQSMSLLFSDLLRQYAGGAVKDEATRSVFYALYEIEKQTEAAKTSELYDAAFFKYHQNNLAKVLVKGIYGEALVNSISRLETFAACAFSHFMKYGLALKEREQFDITSIDTGNILHEVLKRISEKIGKEHKNWSGLDDESISKLVDEFLAVVVPEYGEDIFGQDKRSEYQVEKMRAALVKSVKNIRMQVTKSSFVPSDFEIKFTHAIKPGQFNIGLSEEEKMYIRGKIDRIDTYENAKGDTIYIKVVDYKSSAHKLDLVQLYNGLSLQLVVYLAQAVETYKEGNPGKNIKPAGMYYYHVFDPVAVDKDSDRAKTQEEIEKLINRELRQTGLGSGEKGIPEALAGDFTGTSDVIVAEKTSTGNYNSRSSELISSDEMQTVLDYAAYKVQEITGRMSNGEIGIAPCGKDACEYCDFKSVCGYDPAIKGYPENSFAKIGESEKSIANKIKKLSEKLSEIKKGE